MIDANSEIGAALQLVAMLLADPRTGMLVGLLIAAAWADYGTGRIPNALVFGGTFLGLAYNAMVPPVPMPALQAFLSALAGMACGLVVLLPFYLVRAMGAGDVKLMAMNGAFLGFPAILPAVLGSFIAGGLVSLAYLAATGRMRQAWMNIAVIGMGPGHAPTLDSRHSAGHLPYGIAIAVGTVGYLVLRQIGVLH